MHLYIKTAKLLNWLKLKVKHYYRCRSRVPNWKKFTNSTRVHIMVQLQIIVWYLKLKCEVWVLVSATYSLYSCICHIINMINISMESIQSAQCAVPGINNSNTELYHLAYVWITAAVSTWYHMSCGDRCPRLLDQSIFRLFHSLCKSSFLHAGITYLY